MSVGPALLKPRYEAITGETVRHCTLDIINYTNLRSLLPHLYTERLLTESEFSDLSNESKSEYERKIKLLKTLSSKGPNWPQLFAKCLAKAFDHAGHGYILEQLQKQGEAQLRVQLPSLRRLISHDGSEKRGNNAAIFPYPEAIILLTSGLLFVTKDQKSNNAGQERSREVEALTRQVEELKEKLSQQTEALSELTAKQEFQELKEFIARKFQQAEKAECRHCEVLQKCEALKNELASENERLGQENGSLRDQIRELQTHGDEKVKDLVGKGRTVLFKWSANLGRKLAGTSLKIHLSANKTRVYVCGGVDGSADEPNYYIHIFSLYRRKWSRVRTKVVYYGSAILNGKLALIGGCHGSDTTNITLNIRLLNEDAGRNQQWNKDEFPPMPTERWVVSAVAYNKHLIVAGGFDRTGASVNLVEVLDLELKQWEQVESLPLPLSAPSLVVANGYAFILGGSVDRWVSSFKAFKITVDQLVSSPTVENGARAAAKGWEQLEDLPYTGVAALTFADQVWTLGGVDSSGASTNMIHRYTGEGTWVSIGEIPAPSRHSCAAIMLPNNQLMVVGGIIGGTHGVNLTDSVNIATLEEPPLYVATATIVAGPRPAPDYD